MTDTGDAPGETLMGHLLELRSRLLKGVVAVLVAFAAVMPFANRLYAEFAQPLLSKLPHGGQLVAIDVASPFFTPVKLAFFSLESSSLPTLANGVARSVATSVAICMAASAMPTTGPCASSRAASRPGSPT